MNRVISWAKANLTIVILLAVVVVVLPAAWVGSGMWNRSIRDARQEAADNDFKELETLKVTYELPAISTGGQVVPIFTGPPNKAATEFVRKHRHELEQQVDSVVKLAEEINRQGHELLVEGLFPAPTDPRQQASKSLELVEAIVGREGQSSIYQGLLDDIHAGPPADAVKLAEALHEKTTLYTEKNRADSGEGRLSSEQQADLNAQLVGLRIGRYQQRATEISVYATLGALPQVPMNIPAEPPNLVQAFELQWDYWIYSDLIRAIGAANTGPDGKLMPLDQAVVKRLEKILPDQLPIYEGRSLMNQTDAPAGGPDYSLSVTGRKSSKTNKLYDVRTADMTVVVSSARLPELVDAISRTNLMSVIGLQLAEVEPWTDLENGFYYGPDHVVRATLKIETIWLRSWTTPLMPETIAVLMGAKEDTNTPPPPPPPSNKSRATPKRGAADDEDSGAIRGRRGRDPG